MTGDAIPWTARVLTLFPAMFPGPLGQSLAGKALTDGRWALEVTDIRDFATDRHRSVDDTPFGGGPGMVMRPDVLDRCIGAVLSRQAISAQKATKSVVNDGNLAEEAGKSAASVASGVPLVYFTPRGRPLDQALVRQLAGSPGVVLLCGRFEGVDQRVIESRQMLEVSLGDFILSGGEIAALALIDAVVRLLPGVMGDEASATEESFAAGLLEYPQYTRPQVWQEQSVPDVLLSGHHERIADWRRLMAEEITRERRPDLWAAYLAAKQARKVK